MGLYSYLFPVYLLRNEILFFSYSPMLYYDSFEGFRLCIVDTRRRNIFFIKNKFSLVFGKFLMTYLNDINSITIILT